MAVVDDLKAAITTLTAVASDAVDAIDLHAFKAGEKTDYSPAVSAVGSIQRKTNEIRIAIEAARAVAAL